MKRKITICQDSGFCFGVNRAVEAVRSALSENCGERVCTLGPIVHNKKVVSELEALGAKSIDSHLEMSDGILIIRSHGVAPEILDEVTSKGLKVVDATCPFVKKIHKLVTEFKESEIPVIVIGKKEHPEVRGIVGYAGKNCTVLNSIDEAIELPSLKTAGVVVQTTKTLEEFESIVAILKAKIKDCRIHKTICFETLRRQKSVAKLASQSQVMVIVGGGHSSNTTQIYKISAALCSETHLVENAEETLPEWFYNYSNIGLASGASTPFSELELIKKMISDLRR